MRERQEYALEKRIDDAIITLSLAFSKSGNNEKPVILHSISAGLILFNLGYDADIVIAAILHDILEDTEYDTDKLTNEYGEIITNIIKAVTFDTQIKDKSERNEDMFKRCELNGKSALIVKCADLIDNMPYIKFVEEENMREVLAKKYDSFRYYSQAIKDEPVFVKYMEIYNNYFPKK